MVACHRKVAAQCCGAGANRAAGCETHHIRGVGIGVDRRQACARTRDGWAQGATKKRSTRVLFGSGGATLHITRFAKLANSRHLIGLILHPKGIGPACFRCGTLGSGVSGKCRRVRKRRSSPVAGITLADTTQLGGLTPPGLGAHPGSFGRDQKGPGIQSRTSIRSGRSGRAAQRKRSG